MLDVEDKYSILEDGCYHRKSSDHRGHFFEDETATAKNPAQG